MISAEDALQSVRSAMVLGAVLPEMRQQAETLSVDLAELVRLRKEIAQERDKLARDLFVLADERQRLSLLIEERQKRQSEAEQALGGRTRSVPTSWPARPKTSMQLIAELEQGLDPAARATRAAARASEDRKALDGRPDLAAFQRSGTAHSRRCLRLGQRASCRCRSTARESRSLGPRRPRRHRKRPIDRRRVRAARSQLRAIAGLFMPGPSAIMANS